VDDECYSGLDFTLLFEEGFMLIPPAIIGILWIVGRVWYLRTQKVIVTRGLLYWTKMVRYMSLNLFKQADSEV
jgi:hypothetical protein